MRCRVMTRPAALSAAWAIALALAFSGTPAAAQGTRAPDPSRPACPAPGTTDTRWIGQSVLHGGKGYADTPMGQVHYRLAGPQEGPIIVLLHQTPWSMIQYADIQTCLARAGVRSLAIDTPGYGLSDAPTGHPSIAEYADNIVPVLNRLGLDRVIVAGHHTGAGIASAFAARHPERTAGLLLHGTPLYTPQERADRLAQPEHDRKLSADGSHLATYFSDLRKYVGTEPRTEITANWSTINWYLAGIADVAHAAVFRYDLEADLKAVRAPVLVLSDLGDSLHTNDVRAAGLRPWFRYRQFSQGRSHAMMIDPARWAQVAAEFVGEVASGKAPAAPRD